MITGLTISDLTADTHSVIDELTLSVELSWTIDGASQVRFTVLDKDLSLLRNNYFQVQRTVEYGGSEFEIAVIETSKGDAGLPVCTIDARQKSVQSMKRNQNPSAFKGVSATDYASLVAGQFGLEFVGEPTTTRRSVIQTATGEKADSVWDVLRRSAQDCFFATFEANGILYFMSEKTLLGRWGNYTFTYPSSDTDSFILLEVPQCRHSEDSLLDAEFKAVLARQNATNLRPGMTVSLSGLGEFDRQYLITEVAYSEGVNDPVGVSARTYQRRVVT